MFFTNFQTASTIAWSWCFLASYPFLPETAAAERPGQARIAKRVAKPVRMGCVDTSKLPDRDIRFCLCPDGKSLAVASGASVYLAKVEREKVRPDFLFVHKTSDGVARKIDRISYSSDGKYLITLSRSIPVRSLCVWSLKNRSLSWRMEAVRPIANFMFTNDRKRILVNEFGSLILCSLQSGKVIWSRQIFPGMASHLVKSSDGKRVLFNSFGTPRLLAIDLTNGAEVNTFKIADWPRVMAVRSDGRLVTVARNGVIRMYDIGKNLTERNSIPLPLGKKTVGTSFMKNATVLIAIEAVGAVSIWSLDAKSKLCSFDAIGDSGQAAGWSSGSCILAVRNAREQICIWNIRPLFTKVSE